MNDARSRTLPPASKGTTEGHPPLAIDWCLFLDIDGTLLEHAERPDLVVVDSPLRGLMGRLDRCLGGAVALISGRGVEDVERLFAPLNVHVAGLHGVEHRDGRGRILRHELDEAALNSARTRLSEVAASHFGLLFEDKGLNLALHYRRAPANASLAEEAVRTVAQDLGPRFEIMKGKMVWEIKPSGYDKGTAIQEYLDEPPFAGRLPVFVGDDFTDEVGFEMINERGGHSVKVGPGKTHGRWRLPDAQAVRGFLSALAIYLEEHGGATDGSPSTLRGSSPESRLPGSDGK